MNRVFHLIKHITLMFIALMFMSHSAYASATPPPDQPVVDVHIGVLINDIAFINEKLETANLEITQFLQWNDSRLAFDPSKYGGHKQLYYNNLSAENKLESIWYPNIVIRHIRGAQTVIGRSLTISNTGDVTYIKRYNSNVETNINMRQFPFDQQRIVLNFIPFGKDYHDVRLIIDKRFQGIGRYAHANEWSIQSFNASIVPSQTFFGRPAPQYDVVVHYKRNSGDYVFKVLLPLVLVAFLSLAVFWLRDSPSINSISYVLITLLTTVAFQWVIFDTTPKVPYITFFQSLLLLSYSLIGLNIVTLLIMSNLSYDHSHRCAVHSRWIFPLLYVAGIVAIAIYFF